MNDAPVLLIAGQMHVNVSYIEEGGPTNFAQNSVNITDSDNKNLRG